mmetsp:Transcript_34612/g.74828  ORF Transcript_34612/g.74828 Transcript_34612/m.74828 type:complete len:190 (+) Transcript_34612:80-649(+)|eukprot:CAMPEP_0196131508 /NCGR_PEP_ID=MMETSP0910-20130528/1487_1 /TAXON_ID=49265 /ORGANISM="Thalassiosira rotula, Strain GSO102" /LENGTH=189 /DNA_ID=CAMNT_0041390983 /DNA_START=75 /DNA_END=644 /DNA_ORIENTATION=+
MAVLLKIVTVLAAATQSCMAFAPVQNKARAIPTLPSATSTTFSIRNSALQASPVVDAVADLVATTTNVGVGLDALTSDAMMASSSMILSETEAWVEPLSLVLGPFLNLFSFAMLCRIVLSWYPSANVNDFPFSIVVWPTEPLLRLARGSVPPAFGVDITPVVWLGLFTFVNEILLGQQGLLTMKMKYGI